MENQENIKKKTLSGLIWGFGERFSAQFVSFVVSIILARILMPEAYGTVAIVYIFIALCDVFVSSGFGTSLVQKVDSDDLDFSTIFYASLVISFLLYGVLFFCAPLIANLYNDNLLCIVLRVMSLRLPIASINSVQHAYVSKNMAFKKFFFSTIIGTVISAVIGIIMAYSGYGVWALAAQYLSNSLITTIVLFFAIKWRPKLMFSFQRFKNLFSYGWKITASSFIGAFFGQLKGFVIGTKYTSTDLAYYNKGDQIPSLVTSNINSSMETVFFATMSKVQDDKVLVKKMTRRFTSISAYVFVPILMGIFIVAEPLVHILLTEKWEFCIPYIKIICIGKIFCLLSIINLQTIKALGKSDIILKLEFIKKPVFLIAIIGGMFINPLAIAVLGSVYEIFGMIINGIPNIKLIGYSLKEQIKDIAGPTILSIFMIIITSLLNLFDLNMYLLLVLQILVGVIVYVGLSALFKLDSFNYCIDYVKNILHKQSKKDIKLNEERNQNEE